MRENLSQGIIRGIQSGRIHKDHLIRAEIKQEFKGIIVSREQAILVN